MNPRPSRLRFPNVALAVIVALLTASLEPLYAADGMTGEQQSGLGTVENTQVVVTGGMVSVTYDLVGKGVASFAVTLEASQDGGQTYSLQPKAVTGDAGAGVKPGIGKKIIWEAAKEWEGLQLGALRFRVVIKPEAQAVSSSASTVTREQGRPPTPGTKQPPKPMNTGGGRSYLWPALGLIGGGVAIGAMAAAGPLQKKETIEPPGYRFCVDPPNPISPEVCGRIYGLPFEVAEQNKALMGVGLGIAAGGGLLLFLGRGRPSRLPTVVPTLDGVRVFKTVRF